MTKLQDLVTRWRAEADTLVGEGEQSHDPDYYMAFGQCADELAAVLAEQGWRSMDDCPSDGRTIWTLRDGSRVTLEQADGEHWRLGAVRGLIRIPTRWAPCLPPPPPGVGS